MIIRTVSQLPESENPSFTDLIEISELVQSDNPGYISKKTTLGAIKNQFQSVIKENIANDFSLKDNGKNINVRQLSSTVNSIIHSQYTFNGVKTFTSIPRIELDNQNEYNGDDGCGIPNITKVKDLIDDGVCFIGPNYYVPDLLESESGPAYTKDSDQFMHWYFDAGTRDSTQWRDPEANNQQTQIDGVQCKKSGYLTIFGWLADPGNILPQDCWVALYGKMNILNSEEETYTSNKWVLLQLQPWIRGVNSPSLQYVGFNLPVQDGLWLKIKTGFNVANSEGGFQHSQTKTYALHQPNSFVGYIANTKD